jgi:hypothetical protein
MLTPRVTETRRGSAHGRAVGSSARTAFPSLVFSQADEHRPATLVPQAAPSTVLADAMPLAA